MYNPRHFEERDPAILHALMRAHPLATWVTQGADGELVANHIPFLLDPHDGEHGTLRGHVARANPVWRTFSGSGDSLLVFQGPHAYVSPGWYPSKQEHGKVVPTWNYAVVHAHGRPRAIEDRDWLRRLVGRLTETHEAGMATPWQVADAPSDYIDRMLEAIVGIEIPISRLEGKWKVSQNRSQPERQGVVAGLDARGDEGSAAMAALVRRFVED
jgi:transcriptional regulator